MKCFSSLKLGLLFGALAGFLQLVWAILVATKYVKPITDWLLAAGFIQIPYSILAFDYRMNGMLIISALIAGFISGVILGWFLNLSCKK